MNNKLLLTAILAGFALGLAAILAVRMTARDSAATAPLRAVAVEAQSGPEANPTVDVNNIIMDIRPEENITSRGGVYVDPPEPGAPAADASGQSDSGIGSFPSKVGDRYVHFNDGSYVPLPDDVRVFDVGYSTWSGCGDPPRAPDPCPPGPFYTLRRGEAEITIDAIGNRFDWGSDADDPSQFTFLETDRVRP